MEDTMAEQYENLTASLEAADTSLDEVASDLNGAVADIAALKEQLANGLTGEQTANVQSKIDAIVEKVNAAAAIINPAVDPGDTPNP